MQTSKMKSFAAIVFNGFQLLIVIVQCPILDICGMQDTLLCSIRVTELL